MRPPRPRARRPQGMGRQHHPDEGAAAPGEEDEEPAPVSPRPRLERHLLPPKKAEQKRPLRKNRAAWASRPGPGPGAAAHGAAAGASPRAPRRLNRTNKGPKVRRRRRPSRSASARLKQTNPRKELPRSPPPPSVVGGVAAVEGGRSQRVPRLPVRRPSPSKRPRSRKALRRHLPRRPPDPEPGSGPARHPMLLPRRLKGPNVQRSRGHSERFGRRGQRRPREPRRPRP
jgi:hypothetical protein